MQKNYATLLDLKLILWVKCHRIGDQRTDSVFGTNSSWQKAAFEKISRNVTVGHAEYDQGPEPNKGLAWTRFSI